MNSIQEFAYVIIALLLQNKTTIMPALSWYKSALSPYQFNYFAYLIIEIKTIFFWRFFLTRWCDCATFSKPVKKLWPYVLSIAISDIVNTSFCILFFFSKFFLFGFVNTVHRRNWVNTKCSDFYSWRMIASVIYEMILFTNITIIFSSLFYLNND